jgi:hypothetical protein
MNDQTKKDEVLPQAVPPAVPFLVGGSPESMPLNVENGGSAETGENQTNNESVKFGEKAKESNTERNIGVLSIPQQPKTIPVKKEDKPKVFPSVYGYKVPAAMQQQLGTIKSRAGKGDPKKGTTWLNVFLDRLLKMQSN